MDIPLTEEARTLILTALDIAVDVWTDDAKLNAEQGAERTAGEFHRTATRATTLRGLILDTDSIVLRSNPKR